MPERIKIRYPLSRKIQWCHYCAAYSIPKATVYVLETYVFDSRVYDWKSCTECSQLVSSVYGWAGWPDEGVNADHFLDWALEHSQDPELWTYAKAYMDRASKLIV